MAIIKTLVGKRVVNQVSSNTVESKAKSAVSCCSRKRKFVDLSLLYQKEDKRPKMDPIVKKKCCVVLDALIKHRYGLIFTTPVDPVPPDYFSIISHPMDLGTVKSKLSRDAYFTAEEVATDVKLTFSNAMLYNPPHTHVHKIAKELESIFTKRYKLLETQWKQQGTISSGDQMSLADKWKLKKELKGILNRKLNEKVQSRLRKSGIQCSEKARIDLDVDALDDDALRRLKSVLNGSLDACSAIEDKDRILSTNAKKLDTRLSSCGSGLNEGSMCPRPGLLASVTMPISGASSMDDDQSAKKALRMDDDQGVKKALQLARLTKRYSEIMARSMSDKVDPKTLKQETNRWEQLNKKDKLENHQKEREAFRAALEMVERTVEFEDNLLILKELETLSQCHGSGSGMTLRDLGTGEVLNPLEQLGLRIKKEFTADDTEDTFLNTVAEEGEILE